MYELVFAGTGLVKAYKIPRYRRIHETLASARAEAEKVRAKMEARGLPVAAHPAQIYGPDGEQYPAHEPVGSPVRA